MSLPPGPKDDELVVRRARFRCMHRHFDVYESLAYVECRDCGEKLDPIWALRQIATDEYNYRWRINVLKQEAQKAAKKNRCKCEKCGQMTRIEK